MIDNIQSVKPKSFRGDFRQAKYSHITGKGTVYALPLDNMPCVVAEIKSNMPVQKLNLYPLQRIPNALPEYKIIPGTDSPRATKIPGSGK